MNYKKSWEVRKRLFKERKVTIKEIKDFLLTQYNKKLIEFKLNPMDSVKDRLSNEKYIVYIKNYNILNESLPITCGKTKTKGAHGIVDFNFDIHINDGKTFSIIKGRQFLQDEGLFYDEDKIYYFECFDEIEADLLEDVINTEFNLFKS
ncbi:hypothetical protein [Macrococcoides caseolyticum]|uniref:hypothetical protein n=1 Tax=Macrococcoides caseolyticum TaxID=69966 RepID=UPI000C34833B|nr:hypothetical protein [Macrococcus caseolyticus]PKE22438.1 hypothetical protein CW688_01820 [Macrococcus caseolyticus]PKE35873.1 hypothetical protein CW695_06435 [Macrococcus caseolyticus]PKE73165.1 hypothetical protein CW665_01665 [Macrococcus caseolyticus]PKE74748.1 hypothetical protein CW670_05175 [Macrococcus caseolyticus]PKF07739.1 hypothetical protein CW698_02640 [Macrococcus caseolyticus]